MPSGLLKTEFEDGDDARKQRGFNEMRWSHVYKGSCPEKSSTTPCRKRLFLECNLGTFGIRRFFFSSYCSLFRIPTRTRLSIEGRANIVRFEILFVFYLRHQHSQLVSTNAAYSKKNSKKVSEVGWRMLVLRKFRCGIQAHAAEKKQRLPLGLVSGIASKVSRL